MSCLSPPHSLLVLFLPSGIISTLFIAAYMYDVCVYVSYIYLNFAKYTILEHK